MEIRTVSGALSTVPSLTISCSSYVPGWSATNVGVTAAESSSAATLSGAFETKDHLNVSAFAFQIGRAASVHHDDRVDADGPIVTRVRDRGAICGPTAAGQPPRVVILGSLSGRRHVRAQRCVGSNAITAACSGTTPARCRPSSNLARDRCGVGTSGHVQPGRDRLARRG